MSRKSAARSVASTLPKGSTFFNVDDIPVAWSPTVDGGASIRAFDTSEPRRFSLDSAMRNGSVVPADEFDDLVERSRGSA